MKATYYGQSAIAISTSSGELLFDPFITPNELARHIDIDSVQPDYILLSHAHEDHVADLEVVQKKKSAQVIAIVETAAWVQQKGISEDKVIAMNFGGTLSLPFGTAKMVYALHTNSTPEGDYAGVPAGYLLSIDGKKIYFAGDTALTLEMKLLKDEQIDWAFLPIGGHFTMDVEDAIKAAEFINCKNIVGIHYDTFPPIKIDHEEAIRQFADAGLTLHLIPIGEHIEL